MTDVVSRARLMLALGMVWLCLGRPATAQGLDERMQRVVAKFVEKTGEQVMTVGSWVKGSFNPATSDFDMRLVIPEFNKATGAQQLARWQDSKRVLTTLIKEEFGTVPADRILSRTNLYAPTELMAGIEDASDAAERFQKLNTVPSLGHTGPVNANTPAKFTEGLYGAGSQTYVQGYEKSAGRLYYWKDGKCVTGLSEMAGLSEGVAEAAYTAAGTANTAGQWAEHALAEVAAGRGDKVAKYLERLERDLTKSRSLNSLPLDEGLRTQLQEMRALLKKQPGRLAEVGEKVTKLLARSRTEAAILRSMGEAGPMRRMYLQIMLDGVAAGNKVGALTEQILAKVPGWVNTENAMNCVVLFLGVQAGATALLDGDAMDALAASSAEFKWLPALGPLVLGQLYAEIMIQAKQGGYALAAGFQGAWSLMEGFYSAWGRVDVDPDPRRRLTLADMVARFQYEDKLEAVVHAQAVRAATRDLGQANARSDDGVAEAIFAKCWPVIREAWRWERDCLATEYLRLGSQIVHTPLAISYRPNPAKPKEQVVLEAASFDRKLAERLERMKQIIVTLYGKGSTVASSYYWSTGGTAVGDRDWQRGYTFDQPGTYPVKVTLAVAPITRHTRTEPRIMLRREVQALVDVKVAGMPQAVTKGTCRFKVTLSGTMHNRGGDPPRDTTDKGGVDTWWIESPATVNGSRFEAVGNLHTPSNDPAVYDIQTRWALRGTLNADRSVCTELTVDFEEVATSKRHTRRTKLTATIAQVPRKTDGQWYASPPNVTAATYTRTYDGDSPSVTDTFRYGGQGEVDVSVYGRGIWDQPKDRP